MISHLRVKKGTLIGVVQPVPKLSFQSNIQVLKRRNSSVAIKSYLSAWIITVSNEETIST